LALDAPDFVADVQPEISLVHKACDHILEEPSKARERKRRAECDDPRVAVGLIVSSESGAFVLAETKRQVIRQGVKSLRESWRSAE